MMPTFTHPRCLNCHGGVQPWLQNGGHIGGKIKPKDPNTFKDDNGKDTGIPFEFLGSPFQNPQACQDCHSGLRGWSMPAPQKWFVGKDAVHLCKQIKEMSGGLVNFREHIEKEDPIKFIQESFKGTRGLDENGKATLFNAGREFKNEPPPIPFGEFVRQAKTWASAMRVPPSDGTASWQMEGTCGCEALRYALELKYRQLYAKDAGSGVQEQQTISIPLTFGEDNRFHGEATAQIVQKVSIAGCARDGHYTRRFETSGRVPDQTPLGTIDLKLVESVSGSLAPSACSSKDVKVLPAVETFPAITIKARLGVTTNVDLGAAGTTLEIRVVKLQ